MKFFPRLALLALALGAIPASISLSLNQAEEGIFVRELSKEEQQESGKAIPFYAPSEPDFSKQSISMNHVGNIKGVWDDYKGAGTTIAVIDTGIDHDHPDFIDSDGNNHIRDDSRYYYRSGNQILKKTPSTHGWSALQHEADTTNGGYQHHGTDVSGTAAAVINGVGTLGIAPEAEILALKTDMDYYSIAAAIDYCASLNKDSDPDNDVDVINMSLGGYAQDITYGTKTIAGNALAATVMVDSINNAYNAGIIVIAAAGNHATSEYSYPASNANVIGVGALYRNNSNTAASYSNFNSSSDTKTDNHNVDLVAPGSVYSPSYDGTHTYGETQGTSFASPIVAGAAALYKQKNPEATPAMFEKDLYATCADIGSTGWDSTFGYGRLDIGALLAVEHAVSGVSLNKTSMNMVAGGDSITLIPTVTPDTATNTKVTWTSSNATVASVSSAGVVKPLKAGTTTITVTTQDGGFTATCEVTVSAYVALESINLSPTSVTLAIGKTQQLSYTLTPANASYNEIVFTSSDPTIASVSDDGVIKGLKAGKATITAFNDEFVEAECSVTIKEATDYQYSLVTSAADLEENFDYVISARTGDNVAGSLNSSYLNAVSGSVFSADRSEITGLPSDALLFTLGKSGDKYTLKNNEKYLKDASGTLSFDSASFAWSIGFSSSNIEIKNGAYSLSYNSSSPRFKTYNGGQAGIALYKQISIDPDKALDHLTVEPSKTEYFVGDSFSFQGTLTAHYNSGDPKTVAPTKVSSPEMSTPGTKTVTLTYKDAYGEKTVSYDITVKAIVMTALAIKTNPTKLTYTAGQTFDPTGLTLTLTNNNGTEETISSGFSYSTDPLTEGTTSILVSYTKNGITLNVSVGITVNPASSGISETAKYTVTGNSKVSSTGTPSGSTATFSNNYTNNSTGTQITSGKSSKLTLSGYAGYRVAGITLHMRSNASAGEGTFLAKTGETTIAEIATKTTFNQWFDNTSYGTDYRDVHVTIADDSVFAKAGETIVLTLSCTTNSLYVDRFDIAYTNAQPGPIAVTGISLNKTELSLAEGASETLVATIAPAKATNKNVTWTSSDESVATVDQEGKVTAVKAGNATITATTEDGSFPATCSITVTEPVTLSSLTLSGFETSVAYKGTFDSSKIVLNASYSDGNKAVVEPTSSSYSVDTSKLGPQIISATYGGKEVKATVFVTANGAVESVPGTPSVYSTGSLASTKPWDKSGASATLAGKSWKFDVTFKNSSYFGSQTQGFQFGSGSNPAQSATFTSSDFASNTVTSVKVKASTAGTASISVSVGGTAFACNKQTSASLTSSSSFYEFTGSAKGNIVITYNQPSTSKAMYLAQIDVTTAAAPVVKFTGEEQAKAYADYFLSEVKGLCNASGNGSDIEGIKAKWTTLSTEYGYLANSAKDAFVSSSNANIVEARALYTLLVGKYQPLDSYVVNSSGVSLARVEFEAQGNTPIVEVAFLALTAGLAVSLLAFSRKKHLR